MTTPHTPAFPESYVGDDRPHAGIGNGMTLREYAAIHALTGLLSGNHYASLGEKQYGRCALQAVRCADSLMEELSK